MSDRILLATFEHESDLLAATVAVRRQGFQIVDALTPYAVHGLDRAMGLRPSRLTWVCFVCGMAGALGMLWFQHWTASIDWPLDVGGKPWNSLPSDVPVAFEAAVLLAGFGAVFALFAVSRLFPGKRAQIIDPRVTDDRFVLLIDETDAAFDVSSVTDLLKEYDVVHVEERARRFGRDRVTLTRINQILTALLLVVIVVAATSRVDYSRPNIEILPDMKYTPAWTTYSANPNFANGRTLQEPVPGSIARGQKPLYYESTKEDAERAGAELINPYQLESAADRAVTALDAGNADNPPTADSDEPDRLAASQARWDSSVERGGEVYRVFCISCHGAKGTGDGPVAQRGFPPPPSLLSGKSLQMKDGQLFHILTYGQGSMSSFAGQLAPASRWDVINYVRSRQNQASPAPPVPAENPPAENPPAESRPDDAPKSTGNGDAATTNSAADSTRERASEREADPSNPLRKRPKSNQAAFAQQQP